MALLDQQAAVISSVLSRVKAAQPCNRAASSTIPCQQPTSVPASQALRSFMDAAAPQGGGPYYMRPPASVVGSKERTPLPVQLASQPALTGSLDAQIQEPEHSPRFMRAGAGARALLAVGI